MRLHGILSSAPGDRQVLARHMTASIGLTLKPTGRSVVHHPPAPPLYLIKHQVLKTALDQAGGPPSLTQNSLLSLDPLFQSPDADLLSPN